MSAANPYTSSSNLQLLRPAASPENDFSSASLMATQHHHQNNLRTPGLTNKAKAFILATSSNRTNSNNPASRTTHKLVTSQNHTQIQQNQDEERFFHQRASKSTTANDRSKYVVKNGGSNGRTSNIMPSVQQ